VTERLTDAEVADFTDFGPYKPGWYLHDLVSEEQVNALAKEVQSSRQRRCDGCGFWQTGGVAEGYGECGASTLLVFGDSVVTRGDFGCTQFTPKEAL
jgi:hypothetical protein